MYRTSYRFLAFCGSLMDSVYKFRFFCRTDPEAAPDRTSAADSFLQFSFKRHSFMYQQLLFCQKKNRHSFRTAASGAACPGRLFLSDLPDPDFPEQACYRIHCRRRRPCFRAFCRICRASADCGRVFQRTVFLFSGAQFCSKAQGNLSYLFSAYPEPGASDTAWKH